MAQETKQTQAPILCTMGCGFYGNLRNDGMCSVCYKEFLQSQNSNGRISAPEVAVGGVDEILSMQLADGSPSHVAATLATTEPLLEQSSIVSGQTPSQASSTQSEDGGQTGDSDTQGLKAMTAGDLEPTSSEGQHGSEDTLKPRKSRCFTCRKKVGLTGFDCRCGNVFCGLHRYSDAHSCTFDYKADAAEKIRKENPVVIGEKIQKI